MSVEKNRVKFAIGKGVNVNSTIASYGDSGTLYFVTDNPKLINTGTYRSEADAALVLSVNDQPVIFGANYDSKIQSINASIAALEANKVEYVVQEGAKLKVVQNASTVEIEHTGEPITQVVSTNNVTNVGSRINQQQIVYDVATDEYGHATEYMTKTISIAEEYIHPGQNTADLDLDTSAVTLEYGKTTSFLAVENFSRDSSGHTYDKQITRYDISLPIENYIIGGVNGTRWEAGTTNGPVLMVKMLDSTKDFNIDPIPAASSTQSGAITTGTQTLAGAKTLTDTLTAEKQINAKGDINSSTNVTAPSVVATTKLVAADSSINNATVGNLEVTGTVDLKNATTLSTSTTIARDTYVLPIDGYIVANASYVMKSINDKIATANALIYKGTITNTTQIPSAGYVDANGYALAIGWTYIVGAKGVYNGKDLEVGDMLICESPTGPTWNYVQSNINGYALSSATASKDIAGVVLTGDYQGPAAHVSKSGFKFDDEKTWSQIKDSQVIIPTAYQINNEISRVNTELSDSISGLTLKANEPILIDQSNIKSGVTISHKESLETTPGYVAVVDDAGFNTVSQEEATTSTENIATTNIMVPMIYVDKFGHVTKARTRTITVKDSETSATVTNDTNNNTEADAVGGSSITFVDAIKEGGTHGHKITYTKKTVTNLGKQTLSIASTTIGSNPGSIVTFSGCKSTDASTFTIITQYDNSKSNINITTNVANREATIVMGKVDDAVRADSAASADTADTFKVYTIAELL